MAPFLLINIYVICNIYNNQNNGNEDYVQYILRVEYFIVYKFLYGPSILSLRVSEVLSITFAIYYN